MVDDKRKFVLDKTTWLAPPGLFITNKTCIIADLHFGFEHHNIDIIRIQTKILFDIIKNAVKQFDIKEIIINGDVKHSFGKDEPGEWHEIKLFLSKTQKLVNLTIIKGNHDNYIENVAKPMGIGVHSSIIKNGWLITHGHLRLDASNTSDVKGVVIGHEHPAIKIRDRMGALFKYRCFLISTIGNKKLVVLPSLNPWSFGTDVLSSHTFLSPFLNKSIVENAEIIVTEDKELFYFGKVSLFKNFQIDGV
jgi:putative SbcD/Mre11-related phosphoesterase